MKHFAHQMHPKYFMYLITMLTVAVMLTGCGTWNCKESVPVTKVIFKPTPPPPSRPYPTLIINDVTRATPDNQAVNANRTQIDLLMEEINWYRAVLNGYAVKANADAEAIKAHGAPIVLPE